MARRPVVADYGEGVRRIAGRDRSRVDGHGRGGVATRCDRHRRRTERHRGVSRQAGSRHGDRLTRTTQPRGSDGGRAARSRDDGHRGRIGRHGEFVRSGRSSDVEIHRARQVMRHRPVVASDGKVMNACRRARGGENRERGESPRGSRRWEIRRRIRG